MRFNFQLDDSLPRLAWCARVSRGADAVTVRHGPWVETSARLFFEGAWNAAFGEGNPSLATACFGSGGELLDRGIRFVTPTHMLERIHLMTVGDDVVVSNSLAFVLAETGEEVDPAYKFYHFDLMTNMR